MNDFLDKWKNDSKFKAKTQLLFYTAFMIFALIFGLVNRGEVKYNEDLPLKDNDEKTSIVIPDKYNYTIDIIINDKQYRYEGKQTPKEETLTKIVEKETHSYVRKEDTYYSGVIIMNDIVSKNEVYDIIDYNYLNLNTINQYLSVSRKENDKNIVYIKDIILGNDSEQYISIKVNDNKINIDYTSLLQLFDKSIENCNVEYSIEEIE